MKNAILSTRFFLLIPAILFAYAIVVAPVYAAPANESVEAKISGDGSAVAFVAGDTSLTSDDTNGNIDIIFRNLENLQTTRVSVDSLGVSGDDDSFNVPAVSSDGRYVAFSSDATNLVAGDTNGVTDVFLHDTTTGTTTRVSVDSVGTEGNGNSNNTSISSDGRYVAFSSSASNLVASDTNSQTDIFRHDTQTGTTIRVSVDSVGGEANNSSYDFEISSDGRYITFSSGATNLVAGDTNSQNDIFRHDAQTGATIRVSVDSLGGEVNNGSSVPSISSDGRYVVFDSYASNLVAGDTNGTQDIFRHDTQTGATIRVSVDSVGAEGDNFSGNPNISSDGRYVTFYSQATNLVAGDTNSQSDIFRHDTQTGATIRVSVDSLGVESDSSAAEPSISSDGRYITFDSRATNLVDDDTNGVSDIFRHDTQTGDTILISRPTNAEITYTGSFTENTANDGSLDGSITATISLAGGDYWNLPKLTNPVVFVEDTHFTLTNKPAGLTAVMEIDMTFPIDSDKAVLTFTGNATSHEDTNDVSDLTITFLDDAFSNGIASDIVNYEYTEGEIDFDDAPVVASSRRSSSSTKQSKQKAKEVFAKHYGTEVEETTMPTTVATKTTKDTSLLSNKLTRQGERGDAVKQLQTALNTHGHSLGTDGIFGPNTLKAVKAFQLTNGLDADGIVGPNTLGKL